MNGLTKIQILFHVSPFRLVSSYGRFEEPWRLYLPGEADQEPSHTACISGHSATPHRTWFFSSITVTTSETAHIVQAFVNFHCGRKPVHSGTKMTRPWAIRLAIRVRSSAGGTVYFVLRKVMTKLEAHQVAFPKCIMTPLPWCQETEWWRWTLTAVGAEVNIAWHYTSTHPHVRMH